MSATWGWSGEAWSSISTVILAVSLDVASLPFLECDVTINSVRQNQKRIYRVLVAGENITCCVKVMRTVRRPSPNGSGFFTVVRWNMRFGLVVIHTATYVRNRCCDSALLPLSQ